MKIFIVSSSYVENTILHNIMYLFDQSDLEIILLKENHSSDEFESFGDKLVITLCSNYMDAICLCDLVLFIDNNTYQSALNDIIVLANQKNKQVLLIPKQQQGEILFENRIIHKKNVNYQKPVIGIIVIGDYCQTYCIELALNELFNNMQIKFLQEFSSWTNNILNHLIEAKMVNEAVVASRNSNDYDVVIKTFNGKALLDLKNDKELYEDFINAKPDYVLVACENQFNDTNELKNIFKYRYSSKIDCIIASNYNSILFGTQKIPVLFKDYNNKTFQIKNLHAISKELMEDIICKITLPGGVTVLNSEV